MSIVSVTNKPKQNIAESQKTRKWAIENVDWVIAMSPIYGSSPIDKMYNSYNGVRDDEQFKHLTETFGVEFPAGKIKHIPLIRPLLNSLQGEQQERPFIFNVRSEDSDAIDEKMNLISQQLMGEIANMIQVGLPTGTTMDTLEKYYTEEFQVPLEIATHQAMTSLLFKNNIFDEFNDAFVDKMVSGRQNYRVQVIRIGEDPDYGIIRPGLLSYASNNVKWIKACDWAMYPERLTPTEILDKFGDRMSAEDVKAIEEWTDMWHRDAYKLKSYNEVDDMLTDEERFNEYTDTLNHKITVYNVEWKSIRKITYIENENRYNADVPFIKMIPEDKLESLPGEKKRRLKHRYIQDRWEGVRIGDTIYVDLGKSKYVTRSKANPSKCNLTFNGLAYNKKIKPYSLIATTDDIQNLYDVMHFHKENLIALSGSKGSYMELSQMPDFGTGKFEDNIKMYMYYKKLGTAFIDRGQEGADLTYNQFGTYDDTLGTGLGVVLQVIQHLEDLAGRLVGVNRQRQGAITQNDGKGTVESAIMQSNLVTEAMFNEHDEFVRQSLEDLIAAAKIAWKNGYTGSYVSDGFKQTIFTLNPEWSNSDYGIYITNRISDARTVEELKQLAVGMAKEGQLEFEDVFTLFRKSNLRDIEVTIKGNLKRRKAEIQEQQQQIQQLEQQLAVAKEQTDIEKTKAEIAKLMSEVAINQQKVGIEQKELDSKDDIETAKIQLEQEKIRLEQKQVELGEGKEKEVNFSK